MSIITMPGSTLKMEVGSPLAATTIPNVLTVPTITRTKRSIQRTSLDSTYDEFGPGRIELSSITFRIALDDADATHAAILADAEDHDAAARTFTLISPNTGAATWTFAGYVSASLVGDFDGDQVWEVTIIPTGMPTFAL
jgi:hypothetical protein